MMPGFRPIALIAPPSGEEGAGNSIDKCHVDRSICQTPYSPFPWVGNGWKDTEFTHNRRL